MTCTHIVKVVLDDSNVLTTMRNSLQFRPEHISARPVATRYPRTGTGRTIRNIDARRRSPDFTAIYAVNSKIGNEKGF